MARRRAASELGGSVPAAASGASHLQAAVAIGLVDPVVVQQFEERKQGLHHKRLGLQGKGAEAYSARCN